MESVGIMLDTIAFLNFWIVEELTESPSYIGQLIAKKSNVTLFESGFRPACVSPCFGKKELYKAYMFIIHCVLSAG